MSRRALRLLLDMVVCSKLGYCYGGVLQSVLELANVRIVRRMRRTVVCIVYEGIAILVGL